MGTNPVTKVFMSQSDCFLLTLLGIVVADGGTAYMSSIYAIFKAIMGILKLPFVEDLCNSKSICLKCY